MRSISLFLIVFVLVILFSCGLFDDNSPYSGITETAIIVTDEWHDPDEIIISEDEDDWNIKYEPLLPDSYNSDYDTNSTEITLPIIVNIGPAFPNPATDSTYIRLEIPQRNYIEIYIKDIDKNKIITLVSDTLLAGYYRIYWLLNDKNGNKVDEGIYRCYYNFYINRYENSVCYTHKGSGYGDIKVE